MQSMLLEPQWQKQLRMRDETEPCHPKPLSRRPDFSWHQLPDLTTTPRTQNATMDRQQPNPPAELIISHEPEFPGQVVWQQGGTLGIAPDEETARAYAAAVCREVE